MLFLGLRKYLPNGFLVGALHRPRTAERFGLHSHAERSYLYISIKIPNCAKSSDRALNCCVVRKGYWCLTVTGFDSRDEGVAPTESGGRSVGAIP